LLCNVLNIALEPIFIFKPLHLGVRGSALATAIAQVTSFLASWCLVIFPRSVPCAAGRCLLISKYVPPPLLEFMLIAFLCRAAAAAAAAAGFYCCSVCRCCCCCWCCDIASA
jgi:Na+-driven multidrug efflux pump